MNNKRIFLSFILFSLLLSGCGSDSKLDIINVVKNEIVIYVGANMADGNYDPCLGFCSTGFHIFHSALYKFNKNAELEPDLATGYSISEDKCVYTYRLREDVKFSDGTPLKAEDVVFTYLTARDSGASVNLSKLLSAEAIDNYTVVFTLSEPWSAFLSNTAQLGIVPKSSYDENYRETGIGTGPFKVLQLDIDQQLIIAPNEYYYGTKSDFEKITILNLDEQVALAAARSGTLDLIMVNPEFAYENVPNMHLVRLKTIDNRCVSMPMIKRATLPDGTSVGNDVTSDLSIRQALNIGINREEIINNALNGIGTPAYGRVDNMPWNSGYTFTDGHVEEAIEILESDGWIDTDGDGIREKNDVKAEFIVAADRGDMQRYQLAAAFSESAKPLGINIKAEALNWNEGILKSKTDGFVWGFGDYNPSEFYYWYHSDVRGESYYNPSNYDSDVADEMINKALSAGSMDEANNYWKKLQYDFDSGSGTEFDLPFIWLANIDHTYLVKDNLDIGQQMIHPHGHGMPVLGNLNEWSFKQ